ncbi:MAG TPA: NUDIX hydrolase [Aeromicrobium sp.]|nr:NUDIX hydrolase [Aeromicrobium sp.]
MTAATALTSGDLTLEPTTGDDEFDGWAVLVDGHRCGTIALRRESRSTASLRWKVTDAEGDPDMGMAIRILQLTLAHAFDDLGFRRVEARIPVDNLTDVRAASICGLRREGILRGAPGETDRALLARLVDDPPANSREGFIALLNAGLPTKRIIAQGLLRDADDRVLLCRLTYKPEWDLPGGVVEVGESPADGLVRELQEELGITVSVKGLITVNWLPAWRGWDDACVMLFDLGVADASVVDTMRLQPTEIAGVEWCDDEAVATHATDAARELLDAVRAGGIAPYREAEPGPDS